MQNNFATKEDVVGLFDFCFKEKEKDFLKKNNSPFYITVAIVCGVLVVAIEFFPTIMLQNWFGKAIGVGSLSAIAIMCFKYIMKNALSKTGLISKTIKKLSSPIFRLFQRKKRPKNSHLTQGVKNDQK